MTCDKLHTPPTGIPETTGDYTVVPEHTADLCATNQQPERAGDTHMLDKVVIIDATREEPITWSRRVRLSYRGALVTIELIYEGEANGYDIIINDIECYDEDGTENSRTSNLIEDELMSLGQHGLYELDELSRKAVKVLS